MQGLQQSYTQYFNRKHHKVGHLFQERYKAIVCEKDQYLLTLVPIVQLRSVQIVIVLSLLNLRRAEIARFENSQHSK